MYRVHNGQIPELFEGYFTRNCDVHDHYTRQRLFLHVPKVKRKLGKFGIRYRGVCIWNEILKLGINPDTSEAVFVKTVKKSISNRSLVISWLFFSYCLRFYFQSQVVIYSYYIIRTPIPQTCRWWPRLDRDWSHAPRICPVVAQFWLAVACLLSISPIRANKLLMFKIECACLFALFVSFSAILPCTPWK